MTNKRIYLPLQVALHNTIAKPSIIPNEYVFSTISQAAQDGNVQKPYQGLISVVVASIADISEYCCAHIDTRRASQFAKLCVDTSPLRRIDARGISVPTVT